MISIKITNDDHFTALSSSAQALYLHLSLNADDDGFCNQVSISMFKAHASVQDLEALIKNRYIFQFENGVVCIKHWRMSNSLRKDRYTPTVFQEEMSKLKLKPNGAYTMASDGCQVVAECLPQIREDKIRIEKNREEEGILTFSTENVRSSQDDMQRVVEAWNSLNLQSVSKLNPSTERYKQLKARIREYGVDEVLRAIENVRDSKFLRGDNKKGWTITFDWLIKPNNFVKVADGNYKDNQKPSQNREVVREFIPTVL